MNHSTAPRHAARPNARHRITTIGIAIAATAALLLAPSTAGASTSAPESSADGAIIETHDAATGGESSAPAETGAPDASAIPSDEPQQTPAEPERHPGGSGEAHASRSATGETAQPGASALAVPTALEVTGRIVDADGRGIAGIDAQLVVYRGEAGGVDTLEVTTDGEGRFRATATFAAASNGDHLYAELRPADGWMLERSFAEGVISDGAFALGDLTATRGAELRGTVSVPVRGGGWAQVAVFDGDQQVAATGAEQQSDGTWAWSLAVPAGTYTVRIDSGFNHFEELWFPSAKRRADAQSVTVAAGDQLVLDAALQAKPNSVAGRLTADGAPLSDGYVRLVDRDGGGSRSAGTDRDGYYFLAGVPAGRYALQFDSQQAVGEYWQDAATFDDATKLDFPATGSNDLSGLDADLAIGGSASGTVQVDGFEGEWYSISLGDDESNWRSAGLDQQNGFTVRALQPGTYRAQLQGSAGYVDLAQGITIADGDNDLGVLSAQLGAISGAAETIDGWGGSIEVLHPETGETVSGGYVQDGSYRVAAPVGTWVVRRNDSEGASYVGGTSLATAARITVTLGGTATADFSVDGATISGTVLDHDGQPLADATVALHAADDQSTPYRTVTTDTDGGYEIRGVRTNNYALRISDGGDDFAVARWYGGDGTRADARVIDVRDDAQVRLDPVTLELGGLVQPIVDGLLPDAAYRSVDLEIDGEYRSIDLASPQPLRGVPAGTHRVSWYGSESSIDIVVPESITVTAGEIAELRITVRERPVSLVVTLADARTGASIDASASGWVFGDELGYSSAYSYDGEPLRFAELSAGEYELEVSATGYRTLRTQAVVTEGATTELTLQLEPSIRVSGTVIDGATGAPVRDARVQLENGSSVSAAVDGTFVVFTETAGRQRLTVTGSIDHQSTTRFVTVPEAGLQNQVISLTGGARVTGTIVADNNGVPLRNAQVRVLRDDDYWNWSTYTDRDGAFVSEALAPGTYTVEFANEQGLYVTQRRTVTVGTDDLTGVEVRMSLGGRLVGVLRDAQGQPIPYATVGLARPADDSLFGRVARVFGAQNGGELLDITTTTDENGRYELPAIDGGEYALYSYTADTGTTWFEGKRTLAEATRISVEQGRTSTVEVQQRELGEGETPREPAQTISDAFAITQQPVGASAELGESVSLSAFASGDPAPSVQWQQLVAGEWTDLDGATSSVLWFLPEAAGGYELRAVFSQGEQTLTTDAVTVTIAAPLQAPATVEAPATSSITSTGVTVAWTASARAEQYRVLLLDAAGIELRSQTVTGITASFSGLTASTGYRVAVIAENAAGESERSEAAAFTTAVAVRPGAPVSLTLVAQSPTSALATWKAPVEAGDSPVSGYTVTLRQGEAVVQSQTPSGLTATFTGLDPQTAYTVTVAAVSTVGTGATVSASATTPALPPQIEVPSAPQRTAAVVLPDGDVQVTWATPADDGGSTVTGYVAQATVGGIARAAVIVTEERLTVADVAPGQTVVVTVRAVNAAGESAPASATATRPAPTVPAAPAVPSVTVFGPSFITVQIAEPADGVLSTRIEVLRGGEVVATGTLSGDATVTTFDGLAPSTAYGVRVAAVDAVGQSGWSPVVTVTTTAAPVVPQPGTDPGTPSPEPGAPVTPVPTPAPQPELPGSGGAVAPTAEQLTASLRGLVSLSTEAQQQGGTVRVGGLEAGATVTAWFFSQPTYAGEHIVDAQGRIAVTVPKNLPAGSHRLAVQNADGEIVGWAPITITAADARLADTGSDVSGVLLVGGLLLLGGAAIVAAGPARRRLEAARG